MNEDMRMMRIPVSIDLIRRMDALLIDRIAGYETRAAFVADAIEAYILDMTLEPAPPEPTEQRVGKPGEQVKAQPRQPGWPVTLRDTVLGPIATCRTAAGLAAVLDTPLFGLHNRDYPSLWVARELASATQKDWILADKFAAEVTDSAWAYARGLLALPKTPGRTITALFPTNEKKREAASGAFRQFAIGSWKVVGDVVQASGPLFIWRICQLEMRDGNLFIGLTAEGLSLLSALQDVSLDTPHDENSARAFLSHVRKTATADWRGFETLLYACSEPISRVELNARFASRYAEWTESVVATNCAGYVARAREWGLLEEKTSAGTYMLTPFGRSFLEVYGREKD